VRDARQPPFPQRAEHLVGRPGQGRLAARGQLEPGARQLGQTAGLQEQGPRERGDRLGAAAIISVVVIPGDQDILDEPDRRGQRPPGRRAAPHLAVSGQLKDGDEVGQRVRRGAAEHDRAGLITLRPFVSDADRALGHQQTLAARGPSRR
jgi:hypothetical protein